MKFHRSKWRRTALEVLCLVVAAVAAARVGAIRLENWEGPAGSLTNDLFVPAIMMYAGRGFTNIEPSDIHELRAFLDFRAQHFDTALITADTTEIELHPYQAFHRYLIYTVAVAWRLFGVNWDAVKILILFYLIAAVWCVYAICRLGMNPLFSLWASVSFASASAVTLTLPILRDFVKAPFILAVLLLLGLLSSRRVSTRAYLRLALLTGLLLGVGMGFRRDMMVLVPICLGMLYACRLTGATYRLKVRVAASVLLLLAFLLSGLPIHRALRAQGFVAAHDAIMGFASYSDHELGVIQHAAYEKHYLLNDLYCTLRAHDAARRGVTLPVEAYRERSNDPEFDDIMKRAYVLGMAKAFPADMLTRAYAAVMRIATSVIRSENALSRFAESRGLWFAGAALMLAAGADPLRAGMILALLCYFCGVTSLQFAFRHVFHMSFVPYFFAGLTLQMVGLTCLKGIRAFSASGVSSLASINRRKFFNYLMRMTLWAVITFAAFYCPLRLARVWQGHNVSVLRDSYARAARVPVKHKVLSWDSRVLFAPTEGRPCHECQTTGLIFNIHTRFLVAEFTDVTEPLDLYAVYEWQGGAGDFSSPFSYTLRDGDGPVNLRYYFAVHEPTTCDDWSRFVGISLPEEQARHFNGFYQVLDVEPLGLLIHMAVPDDGARFIDAQRLDPPWSGAVWSPYEMFRFNALAREFEIRGLLAANDPEAAVETAGAVLAQRPYSIQFTFLLAEALEQAGHVEQAYWRCMDLLDHFPDSFVLYARLDRFFDARGGAQRRADEWAALSARRPDLDCARSYLEKARHDLDLLALAP